MLQSVGVLPGSAQARALTDRDYLLCALHLILDDEERLAGMCPACRAEAERPHCPVCGVVVEPGSVEENAAFDQERYERLKRGERI